MWLEYFFFRLSLSLSLSLFPKVFLFRHSNSVASMHNTFSELEREYPFDISTKTNLLTHFFHEKWVQLVCTVKTKSEQKNLDLIRFKEIANEYRKKNFTSHRTNIHFFPTAGLQTRTKRIERIKTEMWIDRVRETERGGRDCEKAPAPLVCDLCLIIHIKLCHYALGDDFFSSCFCFR